MTQDRGALMLLDENEIGDAGNCKYVSLLILALLCKCGPPENDELAPVAYEFAAAMLGPEFPAPFNAWLTTPVPETELAELSKDGFRFSWELEGL